jgi:UrcA family protein
MSRIFKSSIAAFALSAMFAPAALAEVGVTQVSIHVHYGDLDMSNPVAGQILLKRIEHAAHRVCGNEFSTISTRRNLTTNECRRDAVETAVRSANISTLNLAWSSKRQPTTFASR